MGKTLEASEGCAPPSPPPLRARGSARLLQLRESPPPPRIPGWDDAGAGTQARLRRAGGRGGVLPMPRVMYECSWAQAGSSLVKSAQELVRENAGRRLWLGGLVTSEGAFILR